MSPAQPFRDLVNATRAERERLTVLEIGPRLHALLTWIWVGVTIIGVALVVK